MRTDAVFSDCRKYRYALWRVWDESKPVAMFIGLNPSTADEVNDDPTVKRCVNFAQEWGYGGLCMANLFAFRATDPEVMKAEPDPVGPDNDSWLKNLSSGAGVVIAAWGNHGTFKDRGVKVRTEVTGLQALKMNKSGEPAHPLYLNSELKLFQLITDS